MQEVDLLGLQLEPVTHAPILVLGERAQPHRILPVFIGPGEAGAIAMALSETKPPRPTTHDLMATLLDALEAVVGAVEITDVEDGMFRARLVVRDAAGERIIDARPSDAIALAVRVGAAVFVDEAVLDKAGILPTPPEEVAIDAEVDQFRAFLDGVEPDDFSLPSSSALESSGVQLTLDLSPSPVEREADDVGPAGEDGDSTAPHESQDRRS